MTPSPRVCRTVKATIEGERDNKINIIQKVKFGSIPFFFSSQGHVRSTRNKLTVLESGRNTSDWIDFNTGRGASNWISKVAGSRRKPKSGTGRGFLYGSTTKVDVSSPMVVVASFAC